MARERFCFGARSKKFPRQNEKVYARVYTKTQATIRLFLARDLSVSHAASTGFDLLFREHELNLFLFLSLFQL